MIGPGQLLLHFPTLRAGDIRCRSYKRLWQGKIFIVVLSKVERKVGRLFFGQFTITPGPHVLLVTSAWIVSLGYQQLRGGAKKWGSITEASLSYQMFDKGTYNYSVILPEGVNAGFYALHVPSHLPCFQSLLCLFC